MSPTSNAATADNGGSLDPQQAATLLAQTTQHARRQLEPSPPWLLTSRGFIALIGYGAVWLSVRGQHPYNHPTAAVIPVVAVLVVANWVATFLAARRATTGVSGKSRLRPAEIAAMAVIWVGVFVALGFLPAYGVSHSVSYGLFPAAAPLIGAGLAWAAIMATRANWRSCGTALAVAAVGGVAIAAGPAGAWLVVGVGLCVAQLGSAVVNARRQRA